MMKFSERHCYPSPTLPTLAHTSARQPKLPLTLSNSFKSCSLVFLNENEWCVALFIGQTVTKLYLMFSLLILNSNHGRNLFLRFIFLSTQWLNLLLSHWWFFFYLINDHVLHALYEMPQRRRLTFLTVDLTYHVVTCSH
jgi:hypothetical protein